MLVVNLDVERGLVNGALGIVVDFDINTNSPIVKFNNDVEQIIEPYEFKIEWNNVEISISQIPLILGYAITIHKCQSLTLDMISVDLFNCFCNAQVYVALSRVKTLNGLFIKSISPSKITVCKNTLDWYQKINIFK
jgi:ATP-dependent DNA helicase PIF1